MTSRICCQRKIIRSTSRLWSVTGSRLINKHFRYLHYHFERSRVTAVIHAHLRRRLKLCHMLRLCIDSTTHYQTSGFDCLNFELIVFEWLKVFHFGLYDNCVDIQIANLKCKWQALKRHPVSFSNGIRSVRRKILGNVSCLIFFSQDRFSDNGQDWFVHATILWCQYRGIDISVWSGIQSSRKKKISSTKNCTSRRLIGTYAKWLSQVRSSWSRLEF